jgi:hypothetical protein
LQSTVQISERTYKLLPYILQLYKLIQLGWQKNEENVYALLICH